MRRLTTPKGFHESAQRDRVLRAVERARSTQIGQENTFFTGYWGRITRFGNPELQARFLPPCRHPLDIKLLGINPLGINPLGINPLGINPLSINQLSINPLGINPLGIYQIGFRGLC